MSRRSYSRSFETVKGKGAVGSNSPRRDFVSGGGPKLE
jgi:hypothetical protein